MTAYRSVGNTVRILERFADAANEDLSALETSEFDREEGGRSVPLPFFHRPLFGRRGIPSGWQTVIDDWRSLLQTLEIANLDDTYKRATGDGHLSVADVERVIEAWLATETTPAPQPPPAKQKSVEGASKVAVPAPSAAPPPQVQRATRLPRVPAEAKGPPDVWMLSDRPLDTDFEKHDKFGFMHYAKSLATILDHEKTETPFTMAINAPWGAGKSTLANMIIERLEELPKARGHRPHVICRFNAWMHDDAPNLATALISEVSRTAARHRPWFIRVLQPLPAALLEPAVRKWRWAVSTAVVVAVTAFGLWFISERMQNIRSYEATDTEVTDQSGPKTTRTVVQKESGFRAMSEPGPIDRVLMNIQSRAVVMGAFLTAMAGLVGAVAKMLTSTPLGGFVQGPEKAAEAGAIFSARTQLRRLFAQATIRGNRFIVFIDDIERCRQTRSVDVLDAVNQLLDHSNVLVVLLGEMSAVAAAAQLKYKDLAEIYVPSAGINLTGADRGKEAFGRLYIQKIVQLQFDLPIPPKERISRYMSELAVVQEAGARDGRAAN